VPSLRTTPARATFLSRGCDWVSVTLRITIRGDLNVIREFSAAYHIPRIHDSEELHAHAKRIAFAQEGIALSDADLSSYIGRSDAVMIDELGARYGLTGGQRSKVLHEKTRIYEQEEQGIKKVPGAIEFVRWAAQHYRLALATSATPRNRVTNLNHLGMQTSSKSPLI